jgi:hypothetical protein
MKGFLFKFLNFQKMKSEFNHSPFRFFLVLSIVAITAIKLSLLGSGFLTFPDEYRYAQSGKALSDFSQGRFVPGMDALFSTRARPGEAFLNMIPNAVQFISAKMFNLRIYDSKNSIPLFFYNFSLYCLLLILHFKFSKLVLNDKNSALLSVLLFGTFTNSYLYLRHALPYDMSLLLFYWIIYKLSLFTINKSISDKKVFILGLLTFGAYLIYPGYLFLFACILILLLFSSNFQETLLQKLRHSVFFGLGCLIMLLSFELMARVAQNSYINDLIRLSKTISQGSFEESFSFIFKYFLDVEGFTGILLFVLVVLFFIGSVFLLIKGKYQNHKIIINISIVLVLFFVSYAASGYFLHKTVFYGRLLHQFLPFICILAIFAFQKLVIKSIKSSQTQNWVKLTFACIFLTEFGFKFSAYQTVCYPRDWEISTMASKYQVAEYTKVFEYSNSMEYGGKWRLGIRKNGKTLFPPMNQNQIDSVSKIVIVNAGYLFPVKDISLYKPYRAPSRYQLIDAKPHFMNYKAYQYEVYSIEERKNMDAMNLQMRTYLYQTKVNY